MHHELSKWLIVKIHILYMIELCVVNCCGTGHMLGGDSGIDCCWIIPWFVHVPHKVKMQCMHLRLHNNFYLFPWEIPEEISRQSGYSISKGSIHHIKHVSYNFLPLECIELKSGVSVMFWYLHMLHFYFVQQMSLHVNYVKRNTWKRNLTFLENLAYFKVWLK